MNILHVNTTDTSGSGIAAKRLSYALRQKGLNSNMLVLDKNNFSESDVHSFFVSKAGKLQKVINLFRRHFLPSYYSYKLGIENPNENFFTFPSTFINLLSHPIYASADIIHLHNIADFVDIKSFFRNNHKPVIWTVHDCNPFTGGNHLPQNFEDMSRKLQKYWKRNLLLKKSAYKSAKSLNVVFPSEWLKNEAEKSGIFGSNTISKISNGIDLEIFKPCDRNFALSVFKIKDNGKKNILYIADDLELKNKGYLEFLKIFAKLNEKYNFIIAGKGSNSEIFKNKNILQIPYISSENLLPIVYNIADICINLSNVESFSLTTLESLACGVPVISFNSGGPEEIISNEKNGFIVKKNAHDDFTDKINFLLTNDNIRLEFGKNAISEAQKYDINNIAMQYIKLYEKAIKGNKEVK